MSDTTVYVSREELMERLRMALSDFGYPGARVFVLNDYVTTDCGTPLNVWYMAGAVLAESLGRPYCCWSCYLDANRGTNRGHIDVCRSGNCAHPDADRWPPRELLVRGGGR